MLSLPYSNSSNDQIFDQDQFRKKRADTQNRKPLFTTFMLHIQHIQCSNRSTTFAYHFYASYKAYTMLQSMCPCRKPLYHFFMLHIQHIRFPSAQPLSHTTFMLHMQHIQCSYKTTFAYHFYASYTAYTISKRSTTFAYHFYASYAAYTMLI